jgi:integrase/recombinase XerC
MSDLEDFARWLQEQDRSQVTLRGYLADLRRFASWFADMHGQEICVEAVTPADVRGYRAWLQERRASAATVRRHLMALRAYCRWGIAEGKIESDPTERIRIPLQGSLGPRWLDRREQWRLVREAERSIQAADTAQRRKRAVRDWALLIFLLGTGLRVSEVCALGINDVEISERSGWVQVRKGKGAKARKVPLNAEVRRALREWIAVRGDDHGGSLFGMSASAIQRRLAEIGRRAGLRLSPHMLRHSCAKNLIDAGAGLPEVAAILGHSSFNATRVYVTPGEKDLERVVERVAM